MIERSPATPATRVRPYHVESKVLDRLPWSKGISQCWFPHDRRANTEKFNCHGQLRTKKHEICYCLPHAFPGAGRNKINLSS